MGDITTFIIPSVDRPTLQRAIDSVRKQAPYLVEIDKYHSGASAIRNGLIKLADTEWVSMLDDDDTVTDDYVRRLREETAKHPEADVVIFREYFIGELMGEDNLYPDHFIWQAPVVHWGQIGIAFSVKREVAMKHIFLEEDNEDFHFIARLDEAGYKIHFSKYMTYRARH